MDVSQHLAQLLQLLHGAALAIDIASGTTFYRVDTAQNALLIGIKVIGLQPIQGLIKALNIKGSGNFGAIFTMANSASICAVTQRHTQCIQHQRLTGTSFPGYSRSARREFDLQGLYQRVIIDIYR